jgi:predicted dehydrogenase
MTTKDFNISRRLFIGGTTAFAMSQPSLFAQTSPAKRDFKIALIGCGGRGSGAVKNIMDAAARLGCTATLVATSDFVQEKALAVCKRYGCNEQFAFGGPTGYQKIMESPAEIVLLAAPPFFRPLHLEACVKAGKHIFAEKPVATDPAGLRRFLAGVEAAKKANLSILSGTCHRHNNKALRMIKPMQEGAIGPIRGGMVPLSWRHEWRRVHETTQSGRLQRRIPLDRLVLLAPDVWR